MLYTHIIYTLLAKSVLVQGDKVVSTVCMQELGRENWHQ